MPNSCEGKWHLAIHHHPFLLAEFIFWSKEYGISLSKHFAYRFQYESDFSQRSLSSWWIHSFFTASTLWQSKMHTIFICPEHHKKYTHPRICKLNKLTYYTFLWNELFYMYQVSFYLHTLRAYRNISTHPKHPISFQYNLINEVQNVG